MTHHAAIAPTSNLWRSPTPPMAEVSQDILLELSAALTPGWDVEQETDYLGEVSFIALPADDDPTVPAFILYEKNGAARVATIRGDAWEADLVFRTCQQAINRITEGARVLRRPH